MTEEDRRIMDSVDIAWIAGIIEGEGTIYVPNDKHQSYPGICVEMSDRDTVERLKEYSGVGHLRVRKRPEPYKDMWVWTVSNRKDSARILCSIYPMMGKRRQLRISEAVDRLLRKPKPTNWPKLPCGTTAAAIRHRKNGEKPCDDCLRAQREDKRVRRQRLKEQRKGDK